MTTVGLTAPITNVVITNVSVTGPPAYAYQSVVFTATNSFNAGDGVNITGITPATLNVSNVQVYSRTGSNFTVLLPASTLSGSYSSGGTATTFYFNPSANSASAKSITEDPVNPIGRPPETTVLYTNQNNVYDIAVGGEPFFLGASDKYPYHRETATYKKQQVDLTQQPGEQTFEGWWLRSQSSWHLGAGINYLEPLQGEDVIYRFNKSNGVDVWTPGEATLLKDTTNVLNVSGESQIVGGIDGNNVSCVFVSDGANLRRVVSTALSAVITNVSGNGTTVTYTAANTFTAGSLARITGVSPSAYNLTDVVIASASSTQFTVTNSATGTFVSGGTATSIAAPVVYGGSGSNIVALAQDGTNYYAANSTGIYKGLLTGAGTGAIAWNTGSSRVAMGWVKQRLFAGIGATLYQLVGGSPPTLPTGTYTHPNSNWTWTSIAEGPTAIYASGYAGTTSAIYKLTITDTGGLTTLSQAVTAADFPDEEHVTSIGTYLGKYMLIGTNKGVRVGLIDTAGNISYGGLTYNQKSNDHITGFAFQDRFAYATVTNDIDGKSGLIRIDLSSPNSDGLYPWANDLAATATGNCNAVAFIGETGRLAFVVEGSGLYFQHATQLVSSGYIDTGAIRYNTMEKKHFKLVKVRVTSPFEGTVAISTIAKDGDVSSIITLGSAGSADQDFTTNIPTSQEQLAFRFTLGRSTIDTSKGGGIVGYQVKALPANKRTRSISLPLLCYDFEQDRNNIMVGWDGRAWSRLSALETIESNGDTITVQDFTSGEQVEALIEKVTFDRISPPDRRFQGFGGIIYVQVRTT